MSVFDRPDERWVEKVHPLSRQATEEDPLELMAQPAVGDPDVMLECILQEFAWMGWSVEQLLSLFQHPGYPVLNQLREFYGEAEVRRRVETLAARWGQLRFRETVVEPEEDVQVVQITLPSRLN